MSTKTRGRHHQSHASNAEMREEPAEKPAPARQEVSAEQRSRLIHVRAYGLWEQAGKPDGDAARAQTILRQHRDRSEEAAQPEDNP